MKKEKGWGKKKKKCGLRKRGGEEGKGVRKKEKAKGVGEEE